MGYLNNEGFDRLWAHIVAKITDYVRDVTKEQIGIGETSESGDFTIYDAYIPELTADEVDAVCGEDLADVSLSESQITTLYNGIL